MVGTVSAFDQHRGYGTVRDDAGAEWFFHCTEIGDGSRTIEVGAVVSFELRPRLGRYEAATVQRTAAVAGGAAGPDSALD